MILHEKLFADIKDKDIIMGIIEKVKKVNSIQREINILNQSKREEKEKYMKAIGRIDFLIEQQRERCSHELTSYYGDPAGGSDSFTTCDICGKEIN
jgi:hypothetical protein